MIGYITVGTNNLSKEVAFYDALLAESGTACYRDLDDNTHKCMLHADS